MAEPESIRLSAACPNVTGLSLDRARRKAKDHDLPGAYRIGNGPWLIHLPTWRAAVAEALKDDRRFRRAAAAAASACPRPRGERGRFVAQEAARLAIEHCRERQRREQGA